MRCKVTNKKIKPFISFGKMPIANGFLKMILKRIFYELKVGFSKEVSLVQIDDHPKPTQMFHKNYPFYTSSSISMTNHFKNMHIGLRNILINHLKLLKLAQMMEHF